MQRSRQRRVGAVFVAVGVALALVAVMAGVGGATDPTGGATSTLLAQGSVPTSFTIQTVKGTDTVVAKNVFPPGATSGWHSHPGIAVVVVAKGQITLYREPVGGGPCGWHTYSAGQSFLEYPGQEQNGVNGGSTNTVVFATFFRVPHGGSARIDQPDPGDCP
jgi:quercetin dioxygenase-like cupin family protein